MKTDKYTYNNAVWLLALLILCTASCKKADDYLNARRMNTDVVPQTLTDFQGILDNTVQMNTNYPVVGLAGTDNLYLTDNVLDGASVVARNSYIWAKDIFQGSISSDWLYSYEAVEYSNVVLDGLAKITYNPANAASYNNVKGSALFYRAMAFYNLAQLFCKPYEPKTAGTDLGIPLRLSSDVNIPSVRATVQETYDQIINDLKTALPLLPVKPLFTTRPSQVSTNALLAKVYLDMGDYTNAGKYADASLSMYNTLLDFNNTSLVSPTTTYHFPPFTIGNPEVIFFAKGLGYPEIWANGTGAVDTLLYQSYDNNDLRKTIFYKQNKTGLYAFFGSYTDSRNTFTGIATNEVYLIRAECAARNGNVSAAMKDLNTLLVKRWKAGTFVPYTATDADDALHQILTERRKELPFTEMIRWEDLRRLNTDPEFSTTVMHVYDGTTYKLLPNDNRYVYPIPDLDVQQYKLPQNPR